MNILPVVTDHPMFHRSSPSITILTAKPKSGKSFFGKYLLMKLVEEHNITHGYVFSGTAFNGSYSYLPGETVYSKFDIEDFKKILADQKRGNDGQGSEGNYPGFIIFDDLGSSIDWNNKTVKSFFSNYRHFNLRVIIMTQYPKQIPPIIRETATYYVMFNTLTEQSLEAIAGIAFAEMNKKDVVKLFKTNLEGRKYYCIIRDLEEQTDNSTVVYKAPDSEGFKVNYWWPGLDVDSLPEEFIKKMGKPYVLPKTNLVPQRLNSSAQRR